jgi:hypothetical protein
LVVFGSWRKSMPIQKLQFWHLCCRYLIKKAIFIYIDGYRVDVVVTIINLFFSKLSEVLIGHHDDPVYS